MSSFDAGATRAGATLRTPRAKGTALFEATRAARALGAEFAARLSPATRDLVQGTVLAGSWYPEAVLRELLESLTDDAERHGLGRLQARRDLGSVYRSLFRAGDLLGTLSAFPMVWSLYHDSGAALFERCATAHVRLSVRGFALPSTALCAFTAGWLQGAAELAVDAPARVDETTCRTRGADRCVFEVRGHGA